MDYITWLTMVSAWTLDRDGLRWTLKAWVKVAGKDAATKREYIVAGEDDAGVALARLVRLAAHDLEVNR